MSERMEVTERQETVPANVLPICTGCRLRKDVMRRETIYANFTVYDVFSLLECEHIKMCEYIANRAIEYSAEVAHE
jgi:hypothetical protein